LQDDVQPTLQRLAIYDRSRSIYDQTPVFYNLKNTDSGYVIPASPIIVSGLKRPGFAIQAYDRMSGSNNEDGIYSAILKLDDQTISGFRLDSLSYEQTLFTNAQIDYRMKYNGGVFVQQLSPLPGDHCPIYLENSQDISLKDTLQHTIDIRVYDSYKNASNLHFMVQHSDSLFVSPMNRSGSELLVPNKVNTIERSGFELYLDREALYDTVALSFLKIGTASGTFLSSKFQVNDASIPLNVDAIVRIQPGKPIPSEWQDRLLIQRSDRKGYTVHRATWEGQWLSAKFGDFGTYQLVADTTAPEINTPAHRKSIDDTLDMSGESRIVFLPSDDYGVLRKFRAEIDGQWIRFTNDKSRYWIYIFDDRCPYGVHELKVTVEDLVGNKLTKQWWFKRYPYTPPPKKKKAAKKSTKKLQAKKKKK
jgi:hypothetical protein